MPTHESGGEIVKDPVRHMAERLDELAKNATDDDAWYAEAKAAVREAITAVEGHIGSFAADDSTATEIRTNQPRLTSAVEEHEEELARILVELWELHGQEPSTNNGYTAKLRDLGARISRAADHEVTVLYESFDEPPAVD